VKWIKLSGGAHTQVHDEDYELLMRHKWKLHGQGYACRSTQIKGKYVTVMMHRVVAQTPKDLQADHINRDRLDNRRCNLRNVTGSVNTRNQGISPRNTSGYRGVTWDKSRGKWQAKTRHNYKTVLIGRFDTAEQAALARQKWDHENLGVVPQQVALALSLLGYACIAPVDLGVIEPFILG
jgi:hypothetical protein